MNDHRQGCPCRKIRTNKEKKMILKLTEEQIKEIRNGKNMVELEGDQSSEIFNQYGAREM